MFHCLRIFVDGGDFRTAGRVGYFNSFGWLVVRHVVQPPDPEGNRELVSAQVQVGKLCDLKANFYFRRCVVI